MPRNARDTRPARSSSGRTRLTVAAGTAKPMPTLPPDASPPVAICELTPITLPVASSSGPPELPGLIAASVWMTSSIAKPLGAVMRRCSADTTPVVSVRSRPNGLPIATVGSPTRTAPESPSVERVELDLLGVDGQHREVGVGVLADHARGDRAMVGERHADVERGRHHVGVGEDVALVVEHEAGAGREVLLRAREDVERRLRLLHRARADVDDARRGAAVDVARGQPAGARLRGRRRRGQRRLLDDRGRLALADGAGADEDAGGHAATDHGSGQRDRESTRGHDEPSLADAL